MERHTPARVLVTGGAGFVGSHLVDRLVERGDDVTVLDDLRKGRVENLAGVASRITIDERSIADARDLIRGGTFDFIFHLAAPAYVPPSIDDPIADLRAQVEQTLHLLIALRDMERKPRLVHVSSAAIYGAPNVQPIREECPPLPVSPYGVDKFAAEEHVRVACGLYGLRAVILRYFPVYGPRQRKQIVYDLAQKIMKTPDRIEVFGSGQELRDLVYVSDTVEATLIAAERAPARGEAYNVGTGTMVSIAQVARGIVRAMHASPELIFTGSVRPGDSERMVADIRRLRNLGYEPGTNLEDGLARTVEWITGQPSAGSGARGAAV